MMSTNKKELSTSWVIEEFMGLDLGDARLNKRLLRRCGCVGGTSYRNHQRCV